MYCDTLFWAMIFVDFCGMLWALKILCFSLRNSPVTPGRNLLSRVTKFVTRIWDQSMVLFRVLKFLQGIMEGPLC